MRKWENHECYILGSDKSFIVVTATSLGAELLTNAHNADIAEAERIIADYQKTLAESDAEAIRRIEEQSTIIANLREQLGVFHEGMKAENERLKKAINDSINDTYLARRQYADLALAIEKVLADAGEE